MAPTGLGVHTFPMEGPPPFNILEGAMLVPTFLLKGVENVPPFKALTPPIFETESPVFHIFGCVFSLTGGGGWDGRVYTHGVLADGMQSTCKGCQTEHP